MRDPEQARGTAVLLRYGMPEGSLTTLPGGALVGATSQHDGWRLAIWSPEAGTLPPRLDLEVGEVEGGYLATGKPTSSTLAALRDVVAWLNPVPVGRGGPSAGFGDRLGLATPGHLRALHHAPGVTPVLAQQSARELGRTHRTFRDVLDAATAAILATGWREGFGADADHLKTVRDVEEAVAAGFSMITVDPIDVVSQLPTDTSTSSIHNALKGIPWEALEDDERAFAARYPSRLDLDSHALDLPSGALHRAAIRFGRALAHVVAMHRRASALGFRGDFEIAVDELDEPTTPIEHVYLATELHRLGVRWTSFAPRFVGSFEKGIDYRGDVPAFAADLAAHVAIAQAMGGYKISIHSGSDKYSIYEAAVRETSGDVHLKTSGTSYLVALDLLARHDPMLFRQVWATSRHAYAEARSSYVVSASATGLRGQGTLDPDDLVDLLRQPATREILHVGYGHVLDTLGDTIRDAVWARREEYWSLLEAHFERHLTPFAQGSPVRQRS